MKPTEEFLNYLMDEAIEEAVQSELAGEVPIGAVVAVGDSIISRAHNLTESTPDSTSHAEVLAIREASKKVKNWRLDDAILVVTLEPCSMCAGAIKLARIPIVVYGSLDPKAGAMGSIYDLTADSRTGPAPRVIAGVREEQCTRMLKEFFLRRRRENKG